MPATVTDNSLTHKLASKTHFLSLKLYIAIAIFLFCVITVILLIYLFIRLNRISKTRKTRQHSSNSSPVVSKDILEVRTSATQQHESSNDAVNVNVKENFVDDVGSRFNKFFKDVEKGVTCKESKVAVAVMEAREFGWGRWYSLKELEMATGGFSVENVVGEGGYGVVYRGVMHDDDDRVSVVAVKKLFNNKGQAEKEFKVEVEAIGKVRHKNLVGLIGYCAEGAQRILVYEYVNNGNLEQWLHGDVGPVSPLSWDIRMKIAIGTAKGLAYLHEGLEPKVVHRDVKSSNILLDEKWNAKVSDFGLAKLLKAESSYVTTRVMGTFGYVSPEYASTGMLSEGSDVYSFGVLLMELITGRTPIDYSRPPGETNLVDWFKARVASHSAEEVVDPLIDVQPPSRALKRALLVCLRCVDLDASKRPKMGQIVHMLEADDFPYRSELRLARERNPLLPCTIMPYRAPLSYKQGAGNDEKLLR